MKVTKSQVKKVTKTFIQTEFEGESDRKKSESPRPYCCMSLLKLPGVRFGYTHDTWKDRAAKQSVSIIGLVYHQSLYKSKFMKSWSQISVSSCRIYPNLRLLGQSNPKTQTTQKSKSTLWTCSSVFRHSMRIRRSEEFSRTKSRSLRIYSGGGLAPAWPPIMWRKFERCSRVGSCACEIQRAILCFTWIRLFSCIWKSMKVLYCIER
jgi:hypothetical protein